MMWHWETEPEAPVALHRFLLRVCGRAPDALVVLARHWLARDWTTEVALAMASAGRAGQFSMTGAEARLLEAVLAKAGKDANFMTRPRGNARAEPLPYSAVGSAFFGEWWGPAHVDDIDQAALTCAATAQGEAAGLWRAWRISATPALHSPPKRIYLVQARTGVVALAARMQDALTAAGEHLPLVEVFDSPDQLPGFSRRALDQGDLLWADQPAPPVRLAATFDTFSPDGEPAFTDDRPRLTSQEVSKVARYLALGTLLLPGAELARDALDPSRGAIVPTALRGDGHWVWSDAASYYLLEHGVAPDPDLLVAIRAAGYIPPMVDAVAAHQWRTAFLTGRADPMST